MFDYFEATLNMHWLANDTWEDVDKTTVLKLLKDGYSGTVKLKNGDIHKMTVRKKGALTVIQHKQISWGS